MQEQNQHSLKNGTILNHYRIIRVLGAGGFGITYLAEDIQLGMKVVIDNALKNPDNFLSEFISTSLSP